MSTPTGSPFASQHGAYNHLMTAEPWTVDNSESRFSRFVTSSPLRSILKGSRTPDFNRSPSLSRPELRRLQLRERHQRRVSFAAGPDIREFDKSDAASASGPPRDSRSTTPIRESDRLTSPQIREHPFFSRLPGSPIDERKRRIDLFGSPIATDSPRKRFASRLQLARSRHIFQEEEDSADDTIMDLSKMMRPPPKLGELFDDDDNDNENQVSMQITQEAVVPKASKRDREDISAVENTGADENDETDMIITQELPKNNQPTMSSMPEKEDIDPGNNDETDMIITQELPKSNQATPSPARNQNNVDMGNDDQTDMIITQEFPKRIQASPSSGPGKENTDLGKREDRNEKTPSAKSPAVAYENHEEETMQITPPILQPITATVHTKRSMSTMDLLEEMPSPIKRHQNRSPSILSTPGSHNRHKSVLERTVPLQNILNRISTSPSASVGRAFTEEHSIGSDYGDRMISLHGEGQNVNIFDEEYPQLYDSFAEEAQSPQNISLSEFLQYIGISLNIDTEGVKLQQRAVTDVEEDAISLYEQALAAATTLNELETYRTACQELKEFINFNLSSIQKRDREMSDNNPQIFRDYVDADVETKMKIESRLKTLKKFTNLKAQQILHEWRNSGLQNLIDLLKENASRLEKDERYLRYFQKRLNAWLPEIKKTKEESDKALQEAKEKEKAYNLVDRAALSSIREEIAEQKNTVEALQKDAKAMDDERSSLEQELAALEKRQAELEMAISKAEEIRDRNAEVNKVEEEEPPKKHYEACSKYGRWCLKKDTNAVLDVCMNDEELNLTIDRTKLQREEAGAIKLKLRAKVVQKYGYFADLITDLEHKLQDTWDEEKIVQTVASYWNQVRLIFKELSIVSYSFFVKHKHLAAGTDDLGQGVQSSICLFSYVHDIKLTITWRISSQDILQFPNNDPNTLHIKLHRGPVSQDTAEQIVYDLLQDRGFGNLADTLKEALNKIQDFTVQ